MTGHLQIQALNSFFKRKQILFDIDLNIPPGQTHVLMGANGAGKSTLAQSLMGHPSFRVEASKLNLDKDNLLNLNAEERAKAGLFLSFQQAVEIPGLKIYHYLRLLYNNSHQIKLSPPKFKQLLAEKLDLLNFDQEFMQRSLNDGFSGGEKKKMEILQMLVLEPRFVILDEIDSGLDVDAIKLVSKAIKELQKNHHSSILLITHYARILKYLKVDQVHLMEDGKIKRSAGIELIKEIENNGFKQEAN